MARIAEFKLPQRPPIGELELFGSYFNRVLWANGFSTSEQFCKITGFNKNAIVQVPNNEAEMFAAWSDLPVSVLQRYAMPNSATIPFGEGIVKRTQLQTVGVRYCPQCLKDDLDRSTPYIRGAWHWRMVAHCPNHGCRLEVDKRGFLHADSFEGLARAVSPEECAASVSADRYFMDRLAKSPGNSYLDQFPAYVAAEFCTLVGHFISSLERGTCSSRIPDGYENFKLRQLGYEVAHEGHDAVWRMMTEYVDKGGSRVRLPSDLYSVVLSWVAANKYDAAYTPLFRFFQDHIEEHIPLEPGDTFIWSITKRKVFTVATAAREYGLSEARVERISAATLRVEKPPRFLKRADLHAALLEGTSYLTTSEAAAVFGCSMKIIDDLIKGEFITVSPNRDYDGRVFRLVHRAEVDGFVRQLTALVDRKLPTDGLVPLEKIHRPTRTSIASVLKLAFGKKIARITAAGEKVDLANLLFDPAEILKAVNDARSSAPLARTEFGSEMIDIQEARRLLDVKKSTIEELIEHGAIEAHLISTPRVDKTGLKASEIAAFNEAHIAVQKIAADRKVTAQEILNELDDLNIAPIFDGRFKAYHFFKNLSCSQPDIFSLNHLNREFSKGPFFGSFFLRILQVSVRLKVWRNFSQISWCDLDAHLALPPRVRAPDLIFTLVNQCVTNA